MILLDEESSGYSPLPRRLELELQPETVPQAASEAEIVVADAFLSLDHEMREAGEGRRRVVTFVD